MVHSPNNKLSSELAFINFTAFPAADHYFIAYSGGMDSTALLYALSQTHEVVNMLTAIHVNHNIHTDSQVWADHCQQTCDELKIPLLIESVTPKDQSEAACRAARQSVFQQHLQAKDCLLTAHHHNDQIETVLFRLFRGTGLQGLSGMKQTNEFNGYAIHRPWLKVNQSTIEQYVRNHQLSHIEDPSNQDNTYRRNHIRNIIIPTLEQYEPQFLNNMYLTIDNLQQSSTLLNTLAGNKNPFNYQPFNSSEILATAIYHWLHQIKQSAPSQKRLLQFSHDCLSAAPDKNPVLQLHHFYIIRWKKQIYAVRNSKLNYKETLFLEVNANKSHTVLPDNGDIQLVSDKNLILSVTVKYQQNQEKIQLHHNGPHKKLKKVFQEQGIPPWQRTVMPYLYINQKLAAVGADIISAEFKSILSQYKAEYRWLSPPQLL